MRGCFAAALALSLIASSASAVTLYSETFTGQNGKGANGTGTDIAGVNWSIDTATAGLFNSSDFMQVENGIFTFQDTNAGCTTAICSGGGPIPTSLPMWLSPVINTAGYNNLQLSFDTYASNTSFEATGGLNREDDLIVSIIAGGVETTLLDLIQSSGTPLTGTETFLLLNTTSLQIKVTGNTYAASEELGFDNLFLTGDSLTSVPLPASALLLTAALLGAGALRRIA